MELLDKGKHCEEEFCHQLDYLPLKCKACLKTFCKYHIKYDEHGCKEAFKFDYKIPTCPVCNKTIEYKRGKDLDLCLAEHMQKCEEENTLLINNKLKNISLKEKNKCAVLKCKTKEIFKFECQNCHKTFCVKHRMQEDHDCCANKNGIFKTCGQQHKAKMSSSNETNHFSVKNY